MKSTLILPQYLAQVGIEQRAEGDSNKLPKIAGYAAIYYQRGKPATEYRLLPDLVERMMPGAFKAAVAEDDIRSFLNHDPAFFLGRSASGTARFSEDKIGLRYEVDPPNTEAGRTAVELIGRGDVSGSSFQFKANATAKRAKVVWLEEQDAEGRMVDVREIHELEIYEGGPVDFPAYEATTAELRSQYAAELDDERRQLRRQLDPAEELAVMEARGRAVEARQRLLGAIYFRGNS